MNIELFNNIEEFPQKIKNTCDISPKKLCIDDLIYCFCRQNSVSSKKVNLLNFQPFRENSLNSDSFQTPLAKKKLLAKKMNPGSNDSEMCAINSDISTKDSFDKTSYQTYELSN